MNPAPLPETNNPKITQIHEVHGVQPPSEGTLRVTQLLNNVKPTPVPYDPPSDGSRLILLPSNHIQLDSKDITRMGLKPGSTWTDQTAEFETLRASHNAKRVIFVRHGEGIHNEAERVHGKAEWESRLCRLPEFFDPQLNAVGVQQAQDLGKTLLPSFEMGHLPVDLLVVSPLVRAIETAQIAFNKIWHSAPLVAIELCRERFGKNVCDARRPVRELRNAYPDVDFDMYMHSDEDVWHHPESREKPEQVKRRVELLLHWILDLPAHIGTVVVVGHSDYMSNATELLGFSHWPSNCEVVPLMIGKEPLKP